MATAAALPVRARSVTRHPPSLLFVHAEGFSVPQCKKMAHEALLRARALSPKMSGAGAQGLTAIWGDGWFGISWPPSLDYMWIQEAGSRPFTMKSLAGKTIPMWIDDPTGKVARENPKADKRVTKSGRRQVKIFRKAAKMGQRKKVSVRDASGRLIRWREVPASYPGAPGRIARRGEGGRISTHAPSGHQGVRWRNPGLHPRNFMEHSIEEVAAKYSIPSPKVIPGLSRRR